MAARAHALVTVPAPVCPSCGQPASEALGGPEHEWECRNEACPEFGQALSAVEPPVPWDERPEGWAPPA